MPVSFTANTGTAEAGSADLTGDNVESMRRMEAQAMDKRSRADRIAAFVANFCGSMPFVWLHVVIFCAWLGWNAWPGLRHFDPYPYTFLTLVVSLEAIFLSAFILISQNYELRISDRRNQLDLQINLLTEQENTKTLQLLELIAARLGVDVSSDAELRFLKQVTHPEQLVDQIEQGQQKGPAKPPSA